MSSPSAIFDTLYFVDSADTDKGLSAGELQVLDYLACLISVYDGRPPERWGYGFSVTDLGAPFSTFLADAVTAVARAAWITRTDKVYRLTPGGSEELDFQRGLAPNAKRLRFLSASAGASLSMTLPAITDALGHEPGLQRAMRYLRRKQLLDPTSLDLVATQFESLREAVGSGNTREDLMVPTAVWLSYLASRHIGLAAESA